MQKGVIVKWVTRKFNELSVDELYAILQLRSEVFVVEQNCVFQDMDNKDQRCYHLMGWQDDRLVAYTRIVPPGIAYEQASIGRVVTSPLVRTEGVGKLLMERSLLELEQLFGRVTIKIGAQLYLEKFYTSFGFVQSSDIYDEDGIEHIEMIRS